MELTRKLNTDMKYHYCFIVIVMCAVFLRFVFYIGSSGADDLIYFSVVEKLLRGGDLGDAITSSKHWGIRLGVILPVWASMKVFGVSEFSSMLYPMVFSIATIVFIYVAGYTLFNPAVALFSSFVFSILPQDVYLAGVIYPDGPVVLLSVIFIYLFYTISLKNDVSINCSLLAGFVLGIGYYIRETSLMLLIVIPILFFNAPNKKKFCGSVMFIVMGLTGAIFLEMLALWFLTGNPFARFNILIGETNILTPNSYTYSPRFFSHLLDPFIVVFGTYWIAPLMLSLLAGILILSITNNSQFYSLKRGHFFWLLILVVGVLACYLYVPIIGFTMPLQRFERYYHTVTPFASLLLGVVFYELFRKNKTKRRLGYLLFSFYLTASFFSLGGIINKYSQGIDIIGTFIVENPAESYVFHKLIKPVLVLKHGLGFMQNQIITYSSDDLESTDFLSSIRRENSVQYIFFKIPKITKIQNKFKNILKGLENKIQHVSTMSSGSSLSCSMLSFNDTLFKVFPDFFLRKICYATDVYVYQLI